MRSTVTWIVAATLFLTVAPTLAGEIGFVRAERAVASTREGKLVLQELDQWVKEQEGHLQGMRDRLAELQRQIVQQRTVVSEEALLSLQEQELALRRRLEDEARTLNRQMETKQDELLRPVAERLNTVVTEYAEANGFDAIFIWKDRTLIYLRDSADLTDTVVRLYDQRFPPQS